MNRLALVLTLAFLAAGAACSNKSTTAAGGGSTTPSGPALPTVTEAPITKDSLLVFMQERFPEQVKDGSLTLDYGSDGVEKDVISELEIMGITTTAQLNQATPIDFDTKGFAAIKASSSPTSTVAGVLRDLMIIHDARRYVEKAWRNSWVASGPQDFPAPIAYGVDMAILEAGGVYDGAEGYDEGYDEGMGEGMDEGMDGGDPCGD